MAEDDESNVIECTVLGCKKAFKCIENLKIHLSAGNQTNTPQNETLFDSFRKKSGNKFQTSICGQCR